MKIFLESCKVTSKLSVDSFGGWWDHLVAKESDFKKKILKKRRNTWKPLPLVSGMRDMFETL